MANYEEIASVVVVGGGPAGLMAAEVLSRAGWVVDVYDAKPSVGRKFLMAGRGGLNLTHSESSGAFLARYGSRQAELAPMLTRFGAAAVRAWAEGLGIETFVGSSGRVFPKEMKAAPLLRAWLARLRSCGVRFHVRHRWLGWDAGGALRFSSPEGETQVMPKACVLALGGGSWPQLGSDAAWIPWLRERGVTVSALRPANCGFQVAWSEFFRERFAGQPLKSVVASCIDADGIEHSRQGECVLSEDGIEGSLIYALSAPLRDTLASQGSVNLLLDLAPGRSLARVQAEVALPRGSRSLSSHLQSKLGLSKLKIALLRELVPQEQMQDPVALAATIKALPVPLVAPRPLAEAISSAGGVCFEEVDAGLMLRRLPGVFCAGEMLDWEAPTGGYLLTACMATGVAAAQGVIQWLETQPMTSK